MQTHKQNKSMKNLHIFQPFNKHFLTAIEYADTLKAGWYLRTIACLTTQIDKVICLHVGFANQQQNNMDTTPGESL